MPIVRNYEWEKLPAWSRLKRFRKICFHQNESMDLRTEEEKLAFTVLTGTCEVKDGQETVIVNCNEVYKAQNSEITVKGIFQPPFFFIKNVDILVVEGNWKDADINQFMVNISDEPSNESALGEGTPCNYYRNTNFDHHYHDFDEFWVVCSGAGVVQEDGIFYEVREGDCLATGAGHHHDFPIAYGKVTALAIEICPEGEQRHGHLWEQVHGPAVPDPDKV